MRTAFLLTVSAAVLALASLSAAHSQSPAPAAAPVPIEYFFDNPEFSSAALAPDARSLAVRFGGKGTRDRLAVVDLDKNAIKVVAQFQSADIGNFYWIDNERLVYDTNDKRLGPGARQFAPGLFAVNRDGSGFMQLIAVSDGPRDASRRTNTILRSDHYLVQQFGRQDSKSVYITNAKFGNGNNDEVEYINLMRLDTLTGRTEHVKRPGLVKGWTLDHKGEPRLATLVDKDIQTLMYRDPADGNWRKLASFNLYKDNENVFNPVAFGPDGTLYVSAWSSDDKSGLHTFDFATGRVSAQPVIKLADFDFSGSLVTSRDKLLGVRYLSDARATAWFGPDMKALQAKVDALLPSTVNLLDVAARAETPWVLVTSYSDVQPTTIALFNAETGKLNKVGDFHERIVASQMASQELVRYKTRDGMDIPAWLTIPKGGKRKDLPMVVLVHGGPHVRGGEWGWKSDVQFLASRGYAVLEPEFRGSKGYGERHFRAGWKQWGLAMQNDIADGTRWAIAQGIADPKRICIAGASYGGYATLMGLVNDPDLYKCGINWIGVTDINLLFTGHGSAIDDAGQTYKQYGMPVLIGDPKEDAARFKATSPLEQAARIKQPLLMAYGGVDQRVPHYHGRKFYDAVKPGNPDVELIVYDDEGHGWTQPKTRVDFWSRVEKFLDRHIGPSGTQSK
ncbi:alpha/beta hydrolase family protein [Massilia cavernae]|uniref:S9 family peptidase n=1 Tax=Massilia cavernae TaxID=2320864 RepID=A0A418XRR4_9BURK|nr:alpha/beta fold hydrolase [Massilia cavernae]RJG15227.1 S9 family peptidase [Massilia cavernae]